MKILDWVGQTIVVETENTRYVFDIKESGIEGQAYPLPHSRRGFVKYMAERSFDVEISGTKLAYGPWGVVPAAEGEIREGGYLRFRYAGHDQFITSSKITYVGVMETRPTPETQNVDENQNPYQSPVSEEPTTKVGPFRKGFQIGFALLSILVCGIAGIVVGLLACVVTTVVELVKLALSRAAITTYISFAFKGLLVWFLWSFAATAAFPYFAELTYLQAVGLVILTSILFKSPAPVIGEILSAQDRQFLALVRDIKGGRRATQGSPASHNSECAGGTCPPKRSVPQPSRT